MTEEQRIMNTFEMQCEIARTFSDKYTRQKYLVMKRRRKYLVTQEENWFERIKEGWHTVAEYNLGERCG